MPTRVSSSLIALRHRNFRLLWFGQLISFSGSMMQMAALLWHVALLVPPERKGLALGLVGLVRVLPIVVFSMISGVAADSLNRRKLMLLTQIVLMALAAGLAAAALVGLKAAWPIYAIAALGAAAGAFDGPARQALIPMLVPREHLPNAISLNTIMFQFAAVVGPSLAGVAIAGLGIGWAYALNAVSFLPAILALLAMRDVPDHPVGHRRDFSPRAAQEGLRFVFRQPLIRSMLLLDFGATFFASATALLPIFAQDVLRIGPVGYGWLVAAPSVGALVASLAMVRQADRIRRRGWALLAAVVAYGLATIAFGLSRNFAIMFVCLGLTGAADTVGMVLRNIIRHLHTPDHLRGRMSSISMVFFMGGPQLGELEAGLMAHWVGAPLAVILGGLGALLTAAWIGGRTPALRTYRSEGKPVPAVALATSTGVANADG